MKEIQPVNQNILLEYDEEKAAKTPAGIIIPDTVQEKPVMARVVAMGTVDKPEIAVGDIVLFKKYSGTETEIRGRQYLLIPYVDILARVVDTDTI